ncbi:LysR family transcriptional regulator [Paraburkholderia sediminicola]|jgi:DNA-binding transcriptional LysR family regulator|uniref:LysR family transcriptional regulator n=1 Tax=Paraburkholderia sediminicola TaxID=458836 RepID=UPI0004AB1908|nr:LysR family transcriptional regulator [Burkholderia sp. HB1]KFX64005.1 LysR family transcriptional regulator [Burkholderia sp. K24]
MDLKDVDLNLLVVFQQLIKDGKVSTAATALGLSQPAVSNALNRLRRLFDDELFVRTARGMAPTPVAEELAEPIAYALSSIHVTLNRRSTFEPKTSDRNFVLTMTDLGEIYFLPGFMEVLSQAAPTATISTVFDAGSRLEDEMESGRVDLAIGHLPKLTTSFYQQRLFTQRYVCMFRAGHPIDRGSVSLEDFCSAEHVIVVSAGTGHGRIDDIMAQSGIQRNVRLHVPHFVAVADILSKTNLIATVPEKFAQRSATFFGLKYATHPVSLPNIQINLLWHKRYHRDPANRWLRSLIFEHFAE